jgi:enoyl-CoA hydratase/carnithine racemase
MSVVEVNHSGGVRTVTISRPEVKNALSRQVIEALLESLRDVDAGGDVGAVVFTGAGDAFSSGADLREVTANPPSSPASFVTASATPLFQLREEIRTCPLMVIAAVNGPAVGGGFSLAMACDFVIASDNAFFWLPEVAKSFVPVGPVTELVELLGRQRAMDLLVNGVRLSADEACSLGLVCRVSPASTFADDWRRFADEIANKDRLTLALTKRLLRRSADRNRAELLEAASDTYAISKLAGSRVGPLGAG